MHQDGSDNSEIFKSGLSASQQPLAGIPITAQALCRQLITEASPNTNVGLPIHGQSRIPATVPATVGTAIKHELPSRHSGATGGTIHHHGPIPPRTGSSPSHTNLQQIFKMSNQQSQKTLGSTGHSSSAFAAANKLLAETKPLSGLSSTFPNLTAFANQSASGPSPKKKVKLEEKPPPTTEIANLRKFVIDHKIRDMLEIKENFIENLSELFFLQNGGNMMDYFGWKKRPTPQLVNFLKSSYVDSDEEEDHGLERKINDEVKVLTCSGSNVPIATPVAISTTLPPSVAALNQLGYEVKRPGGRHGMVFGHAPCLVPQQIIVSSPVTTISQESVVTSIPQLSFLTLPQSLSPLTVQLSVTQPEITTSTTSSEDSITSITTAVTMPQLQSQLTKTVTDTKPLISSVLTKSSSSPALSTVVKSSMSPPVSPHSSARPSQISAVYDGTVGVGTQEAIVERAKQEAQVMQRVAELRKDGMWSSRRLPKVQEPPRCKGHWDYLLEEMQWLAADFQQERKWKKVAARKLAKMVSKHFQELEQKELRAEEEEGKKLKKIASQIAKHVKEFWSNIEKVVQYKHQSRLEEKRKKALDLHLNFIVDQTEKYSTWLTEGLKQESTMGSTAGSVGSLSEAGDDEFKPEGDESDDEETIQKEEEEDNESSTKEELEALQKESEVPLEDLLKTLPSDILEKPASLPDVDDLEEEEDEGKDKEFKGEGEDEEDLEDTIDEQEKHDKKVDYSSELKDLEDEQDLPMEELYKKYAAAYDSDFEVPEDESEEEDDDEEDETEEEISDEEMEDEEEVDVDNEEVGLESLMDEDKESQNIEDETGPGKELTDIAAQAQSLQPKGYTLETTTVKTTVPFLLKHSLREYQHVGLDWLATMYEKRLNGILADEMGLGKTIQTIALLAHLACEKVIWGPHLIVVPTSVMLNWEMELKKWCPAFKILTYYGTQKERKLKRQGWTKTNAFHVCITSYKLVIQDHQAFRRKKWKYLILDEAQNIKNFKSQRWQMLLNFSSQRRLLLTGTPLQNSLMELWSLMHFLMPHVFQSHKEFKEWFANPLTGMIEGSHEYNESLIRRLHKVLRPFLLRRLKADVEKQMPKKFEHVVMCHLSKRQRYLYDDFMSQGATKDTLQSGHFMSVINVLMQLRKVCNHPSLFDPRPIISPFQTEGITYYTSSFVLKALEYDPFRDIDLYSLYPSLADMELNLPAFVAHRVRGLQTNRKLIEEIDDIEESEERPEPGKLQPTSFPNVVMQGGSSLPLVASQGSLQTNSGLIGSSVPVMTPTVTSVSTQGLVTMASTTPVTSLVQTNKQQAKVTPQSAGQTIGQASIQTPSSTQPITVQIQQTDQGARLMIPAGQLSQLPAGFIQIVQTSLGQQIIATSTVNSVTTASSAVVNGHAAITTTACSSVTSTTMSTAVRTTSVQLPISSTVSQKPVMRVSPLNTDSQVSSSIINVTDSSGLKMSTGQTPVKPVRRKPKKDTKKTELFCNSLEEKKMREREQKLDYIARMNEKHCSRVPVYGQDLCHTVDIFRDMNKTCVKDNTWKGLGMVHCHNVHTWPNKNHPNYYWKQTKVLSDLINTPEHYLQEMEDVVLRYTFVTPPCTAPRIQMHVSHPPSHHLVEEKRRIMMLQSEVSPKATCLHPISTRLLVQFPEKRLIQYDCGKLQVMDILLQRLKTEGHRVLIFTQMTKMLNILEAFLNYHGHRYLRLDGTTRVEQRQFLMDRFNADKRIFVFILSTRSGGIGVNLTGADTVIFYDSDWNPTMDAQAQDRCHRIGQTRDVHIYRLISERTVEENILKKANQKRMLGDMAIEGGNFTTTFFKEQTIKDLFSEPSGLDSLVKEKQEKEDTPPPETTDLKMKSLQEVAGDDDGDSKQGGGDATVINQFEKALAKTEDETDVVAVEQVMAEQKAELAEFDENIPWDEREAERKREEDESKVEMELAMLEKELTPVERYAVSFMEEELDPAEELQIAEEDIENAKKEWELGRLKALKEEEERRLEVEEDEMLFTYTREDAFNKVKKSAKKAKAGGNKAKTPARTPSVRKKPAKWKDENVVIDEDKRRSDQGLSETPKAVRPVGRPPKNKTPKSTRGRRSSKIDVETVDEIQDAPKQAKAKKPTKSTPHMSNEEKVNAQQLVSKILAAQANQKQAVTTIQSMTIQQQQQATYSQQLLAQSQKAGLSQAQLASAIQKIQAPNPSKSTLQPQLLSASQLQHLKQIISNAHRNIAPGQQTLQQSYVPQSPVKSMQNPSAPVQQLFLQTSPSQQGQFVISQGQNMVPQIITQQQLAQMQQLQGSPSFVQVQGRGGSGTPTLLQIQGSQAGGTPSLVQVQQSQNIPTFLQIQGSQVQAGSTPLIQVQGSQQMIRPVQLTKPSVQTSQVVHLQTSPSALLAQIQASRVHGSQQFQGLTSRSSTQTVTNPAHKSQPTIVQAQQGTQLVIPPSNMSSAKQGAMKGSQFPGYVPNTQTTSSSQVKLTSNTTPSIINVQSLPQLTTKSQQPNKLSATQYATVQDIQLVVSNASNIPKVVGSQVVSRAPGVQQIRANIPQQNVQIVKSQQQMKTVPQSLQQVITQNSAGQPVVSFIRMAGNPNITQQNIVQVVNPVGASATRPQTSPQQGVVYLQLAGGKAIPVSLASSHMTLPIVKSEGAKGQVRNVMPTIVVTQGNTIQMANGPVTTNKINSPVSRFQVAGNIGQVQRVVQPRIRSPIVNPVATSARPAIATVGMAARLAPTESPSAVPPPWNNPNLVIRTRRAAVQEASKVENGEIPVVGENQNVTSKVPPEVINVTTSSHIPNANVEIKNGCVPNEVKDHG